MIISEVSAVKKTLVTFEHVFSRRVIHEHFRTLERSLKIEKRASLHLTSWWHFLKRRISCTFIVVALFFILLTVGGRGVDEPRSSFN